MGTNRGSYFGEFRGGIDDSWIFLVFFQWRATSRHRLIRCLLVSRNFCCHGNGPRWDMPPCPAGVVSSAPWACGVAVCVVRDVCHLLVKSCCWVCTCTGFLVAFLLSRCVFQQQLKLATVLAAPSPPHTHTNSTLLFCCWPTESLTVHIFSFFVFQLEHLLVPHCKHFGCFYPTCFLYCFPEKGNSCFQNKRIIELKKKEMTGEMGDFFYSLISENYWCE